jgi:hypothetical protein
MFPLGIKKPLKQGKVHFYWHVICNINLAVFQPRSKHYFSGLGEVLGFHQVKTADWLSQQKLWDSREALWSVRVWLVVCTENPAVCLYWTYKNLFDNMLHMVQRITSYHENESSLTHVYKGTLFSHLIDLVRFVVSLGTCLFWPAKSKWPSLSDIPLILTRHNRTAALAAINHSRKIQNFWSRMQHSHEAHKPIFTTSNLHCLTWNC